ncbi:MAG: CHRD domain-containing protein [Propionibacteriales bacterium]|nr:CHRD domain-containing protein [Propionibacteriales bacterium]
MPSLNLRLLGRAGVRALTLATSTCVVATALAMPATAGDRAASAAATAASQQQRSITTLTARLNGENEVPNADRNGYGRVRVRLNPATRRVCARATWHRIGTPVAAHIHRGRRGVNGDVVIDLSGSVTGGANCVKKRRTLIVRILAHPRRFYFNIHNAAYPGGAIRGQLHR